MKTKVIALTGALALFMLLAGTATATKPEKVYVCHAAGQEGTLKYVTLHVPATESGYPKGHFTEGGTTAAGHENDYLGKCKEDQPSPTPTPTPSVTPSVTPSTTPSPTSTPTPTPATTATPSLLPTVAPTPTVRPSGAPVPRPTAPPTDTATLVDSPGTSPVAWLVFIVTAAIGAVATVRRLAHR